MTTVCLPSRFRWSVGSTAMVFLQRSVRQIDAHRGLNPDRKISVHLNPETGARTRGIGVERPDGIRHIRGVEERSGHGSHDLAGC